MASRRDDLGSWLQGTPGDPAARAGLGLPVDGPGSLARVPRRIVALCVDWLASMGVSGLLFPSAGLEPGFFAGAPLATTGVFAVSTILLVGLLGTSVGHRLTGVRVVRLRDVVPAALGAHGGPAVPGVPDPRDARARQVPPPGLLPAVVRTVLLCLVIPAVVWDSDGRGLHDTAAGTALVRR